jgi:hypothetical protein
VAALGHLAARRLVPVAVECLTANTSARAFYEALGACLAAEHTWYEDDVPLPSLVYGWDAAAVAQAIARRRQ